MRRNAWIFVILLGICSGAEAQTLPDRPKVELAASVGVITAKPDVNDSPYNDEWYGQGRYAGSISYYWTKHLKTEFEHQWSGEGELYILEYARFNGLPYPTQAETFHQLQQSSLRMVWQFGDNAWVHPYVSAGAVLDIERQHSYVPPIYQTNGRDPVLLRNAVNSGQRTELRGGWTIGAGAKFYMTENTFFNTAAIGTFTMPRARSVSVIAGFGIDF
jgi:opacity protein-like surface antigen